MWRRLCVKDGTPPLRGARVVTAVQKVRRRGSQFACYRRCQEELHGLGQPRRTWTDLAGDRYGGEFPPTRTLRVKTLQLSGKF